MANSGPLNSAEQATSVLVGGVHNVTAPAPADGQTCALQVDSLGNLKVTTSGGGVTSNINIAEIGGNPEALSNPLPVELSDGTNAFGTLGNPLSVNVISGGGSNASVGATGTTAPTSATEIGIIVGGNLVGVSSANPAPVSLPTGQAVELLDAAGTNKGTIKPASTAAVAADTSLVVQINPSQPNLTTALNITPSSNTSQAQADAANNSINVPSGVGGGTLVYSTYPRLYNGTTWDRYRSAGVGNAVASTGLAASVPYVQYNTTVPAPSAAQYTAAQCDTTGSTYINIEGRKATYSAFASFTAVAGDIAILPGSASKTIRVIRVEVSFTTSGTAAVEAVQLIKRSAADTGGTSAAMTAVPHDSNFSAASAAPLNYTVAPTPGAAVGTIRGVQFNDASSLVPGANTWIWDFGSRPSAAIVLRGVAQMLCIALPTAIATQTATVSFEWTEE